MGVVGASQEWLGRYDAPLNNEAFLYQTCSGEADDGHAQPVSSSATHQLRRGNKYSAEHSFKQILHNDDQPRVTHAEAQNTDPALLPHGVAEVFRSREARTRARKAAWRAYMKTAQARSAGNERVGATIDLETGLGL
jgi:hypothetical protein